MVTVSSVVCPVCGCLCDDLEVEIENGRIIAVRNACSVGEAKFLNYWKHRNKPMVRKNGELIEVSIDEAIRKAAEILAEAKYPILYGWSSTTCEAIKVGLELAEELGGVIDNTATVCHGPSLLAIQDVGYPGFTLGQSRHRFDLVIYWGSNPWSAHFRDLDRYSAFSEGRFQISAWRRAFAKVYARIAAKKMNAASKRTAAKYAVSPPFGSELVDTLLREDRKLVVVDVRRTATAFKADYFLQVKPNKDFELLQAFRVLVKDGELDVDEVAGVPVELMEEVVDVMINCRVGVLYFGVGLTMSKGKIRNIEAAINLTKELNARTKFHILPMRGHYNVTGANVVFAWTTGFPYAVDFSHGYPYYNPGETSVVDILCRGETDASLVIASDPVANFPKKAVKEMVSNPLIAIDPAPTPTTLMADVVIPAAYAGIEAPGTAYRMDHVPISLRKVVEPPPGCIPDEVIVKRILNEVRRLRRG